MEHARTVRRARRPWLVAAGLLAALAVAASWPSPAPAAADRMPPAAPADQTTPTVVPPAMPTPTVQPTSPLPVTVCRRVRRKVPQVIIDQALANPRYVYGYDYRRNPNVPPSAMNQRRLYLTLQNPHIQFHPLFNTLVFRAGCP